MVGAGRAQFGKPGRLAGVYEPERRFRRIDRGDHLAPLAQPPAQPGQQVDQRRPPRRLRKVLVSRAPERRFPGGALRHELLGPVYQAERKQVAFPVVVGPVDEAVPAQHNAFRVRALLANAPHIQAQFEPGPLPVHPRHLVAVRLAGQFGPAIRRGDRNGGHRVRMVHMPIRHEPVQGRVDAGRPPIQIEHGVRIHRRHGVLRLRFQAALGKPRIGFLQGQQLVHIQRREIFPARATQVAAGPLDPEHLRLLPGNRVPLHDLGRRIAAAGVRKAPVAPQQVRAIHQASQPVEGGRLGLVPLVFYMQKGGGSESVVHPVGKMWRGIARKLPETMQIPQGREGGAGKRRKTHGHSVKMVHK